MTLNNRLGVLLGVLSVLAVVTAPARAGDDGPGAEKLAKVADAVAPSLVRVEYTLKYDKGDSPGGGGQAAWMRSIMGAMHDEDADSAEYEELIREERPLSRAGFLLGDGRVVTADPLLHPRFIGAISVRFNDKAQPAAIDAYAKSQGAIFLRPAGALAGAKPLAFDAKLAEPFCAVNFVMRSGAWTIGVGPAPSSARAEQGSTRRYTPASKDLLVVDPSGKGVGMSFNGALPLDGSWKGSPADWPAVKQGDMTRALADLDKSSAASLPRVAVRFRSPRAGSAEGGGGRFRGSQSEDGDGQTTEWNGTGVLVNPTTVLVLADFKPKLTARLESVQVFAPDGKAVTAKFAGTLKDYEGFLVTLSAPMSGEVPNDQ